ncbi:UDP-glucuronosyl/UDP-glucosyltransferase [Parasponia andersonii]|uniref:UDP-glucuronosyl/UDP-glucosyltransferase n=1 Tax=Parasponia andersonii TaxID=3476 RepID=A0A2P5BFS5_PARAD|nr:UDP-glucuronosyl/UDP-glucosyltransferase [Parasponia andersonii]
MSSINGSKPHAVCLPFPAQGHVNPMFQLAKLLHSRGFHITFVNTEFNHRRLIRSRGPDSVRGLPDFRFETIPDGLPPSDRDATQDVPPLCDSTRKNCLGPFKELLLKLKCSSEVPPITCIIVDGIMTFGIEAAKEFGIPEVLFWTASACSFMGYLQFDELLKRGIVPFRDENFIQDGTLDTPIDWIPGMKNMRLKDLPSFMRTLSVDDIMFDFLGSEAQNCLKSSAIIFNTFREFEHEVLDSISAKFPNIYTIGPLPLLNRHLPAESQVKSLNSSLWAEDSTCLEWLNKREPNSVVYVNYGSITTMTEENLREFAWGLAKSKHPFLWIIRPDVVTGSDSATALPEEFFEEIKDRGLLANWCPQKEVLEHSSVGVFLTHCGWNSTLETICSGVPMICWPFFADQQTNCHFAFRDENFIQDGTLDTPIDWIPGMKNMRLKDLPSFMRTLSVDDIMFDFLGSEAQNCLKSSAILFNTFREFEHEVLDSISAKFPSIYTIGPLPLLNRHLPAESQVKSLNSSLWAEDSTCLEWLNKREPNSVVYVNYGSITTMTEENLREFAWGLAKSKHPFLWIIRPDVVTGSDSATALPEEFFEEIKDRGLLANWCPQKEVLEHSSVGVFLTHCGWNSTLETICSGVPMICWPFFADQQTNCHFACTAWGIGVEVNNDVKRDEVSELVKEMMEGNKGKKMREKALEWKKKAVEATDIGGESYNNFERLIREGLGYGG